MIATGSELSTCTAASGSTPTYSRVNITVIVEADPADVSVKVADEPKSWRRSSLRSSSSTATFHGFLGCRFFQLLRSILSPDLRRIFCWSLCFIGKSFPHSDQESSFLRRAGNDLTTFDGLSFADCPSNHFYFHLNISFNGSENETISALSLTASAIGIQ